MVELKPWTGAVEGVVRVPGDKSLTHRGILLSALAAGVMTLNGWLDAGDTRSSLGFVQSLGVEVLDMTGERLVLRSSGHPEESAGPIDCGNSGTTMRLATGIAAAVPGLTILTGDASLMRRPMARVATPLQALGVPVWHRQAGTAPLVIQGGPHAGGAVSLPVASAQVKSAILLAGVTAEGSVTVEEPVATRDHTERLLRAMGVRVETSGQRVRVFPGALQALSLAIPGDPSSAAFWAALAALRGPRRVTLPNVLLNPGRIGFFALLERMGADIRIEIEQENPEPVGTIQVESCDLRSTTVRAEQVPSMVDELPLAALVATQARGITRIQGAQELRVKESDRLQVTREILGAMGAKIQELPDGWVIEGPTRLHAARVDAHGDHRMAMLAYVASTVADGLVVLSGEECVAISYPGFFQQFHDLSHA